MEELIYKKHEFFEELSEYVNMEQLCDFDKKSYDDLKAYFDDNQIYKKMGSDGMVTCRTFLQNMSSDSQIFLKANEKGQSYPDKLCKDIPMPDKPGAVNDYVLFFYFFLMENHMILEETDYEELFVFLADAFGYELYKSYFVKREEFVLFCALRWKSTIYQFNQYLSEKWADDAFGDLESIIEETKKITVGEFIRRIDDLCNPIDNESNLRDTRVSVEMSMDNIDLIRVNVQKPEKDETFLSFCKNHDEYNQILCMIQNTEPRRRWYLYRIIQKIVLKQIEHLKKECRTVKDLMQELIVREQFKATMINPIVGQYTAPEPQDGKKTIDKPDETVVNYLYFFGFDYSSSGQIMKQIKKLDRKKAAEIILAYCEEKGEKIYMIDPELVGKLRKYGEELNGDLKERISNFLDRYKNKTEHTSEHLEKIILENCYMKISDILYIYELFFDDKSLHKEVESEDMEARFLISRMVPGRDDWIKRCIARGMTDDEILKIHQGNTDKVKKIRKELIEHYETVVETDGAKEHGFGIRTDSKAGELFDDILTGKETVSREMLLSFVLLAKVFFVNEELSWDYIRFHVLENSRFDKDTERSTPFNEFFVKAKDDLDNDEYILDGEKVEMDNLLSRSTYLSEMAADMEIQYLKEGIAPFSVMFSGGALD